MSVHDSMTIRDTFAAAAMAGLLARQDTDCEPLEYGFCTELAYKWADAMLRERAATNHDAAPAARARTDADTARTDNAAPGPGEGTGDAPVTEPMPKTKPAEVSDTLTEPVADSDELLAEYLLWKTRRCEPQPLAAGWRGENRADGSGNRQSPHPSPVRSSPVTDDRPATTAEPVAFAVYSHWYSTPRIAENKQEAHRVRKGTDWIAPLYLQPQLTLTDAEREAISDAADLCEATAGQAHGQDNAAAWAACAATLRGMRERLRGGK